jgi:hypothetical protein
MGIPAGLTKVVLRGTLAGGEIFETGFWLSGTAIASEADANAFCATLSDFLADGSTIQADLAAVMDSASHMTQVRSYTYTGTSTATYVGSADCVFAGTSASHAALQQCVVLTLNTGLSGRRNRGRMYWPATGLVTTADGCWGGSAWANLADAFYAVFSSSGAIGALSIAVVVSQTGTTSHPITTIKVDNKPDIQRRRANKLAASAQHVTSVIS